MRNTTGKTEVLTDIQFFRLSASTCCWHRSALCEGFSTKQANIVRAVVVINNDKKVSHFDKSDKRTSLFDAHKKNAYRPGKK